MTLPDQETCDCCKRPQDDLDEGICGECYERCSLTCAIEPCAQYSDEEIGGLGSGSRYPSEQQEEDLHLVVEAARRQLFAQHRREVHQLATILANTRPNDHGTEGEWALRLHEAGVRPPRARPRVRP